MSALSIAWPFCVASRGGSCGAAGMWWVVLLISVVFSLLLIGYATAAAVYIWCVLHCFCCRFFPKQAFFSDIPGTQQVGMQDAWGKIATLRRIFMNRYIMCQFDSFVFSIQRWLAILQFPWQRQRELSLAAVTVPTVVLQLRNLPLVVYGCVSMSTRIDPWGSCAMGIAPQKVTPPGSVGLAQARAHPLNPRP